MESIQGPYYSGHTSPFQKEVGSTYTGPALLNEVAAVGGSSINRIYHLFCIFHWCLNSNSA